MSAISLSSFSYRPSQGATLPSAQQTQTQRGTTYGSFSGANAVRGNNNASSAAYCPTCGANASRSASSSYCPTCNRTGGTQSNITRSSVVATGSQSQAQGGRICVGCAYQGR